MKIGDLVKCVMEQFVDEAHMQSAVGIVLIGGKSASLVAFGGGDLRWMSHEWLEVLSENR